MIALALTAFFVGLAYLAYLAFPAQRVSKKRLGIEHEKRSLGQSVAGAMGVERERRLAQALNLADVNVDSGTFALRVLVASILLAIPGLLFGPLWALVGLVLPYLLARSWVARKGSKRREAFAAQLPNVLQLLISALRSGFSLPQALESVASEADEPSKSEFERMLTDTRIGVDMGAAMKATAQRMESKDLEWIASAVDINRETGGNLAEVLENVTTTIRGRYRLRRNIKTLTAEGRLSVKVLTGLPIAIFVGRTLLDSNFRDVMFDGFGLVALVYGAISMTLGWLWVRKIIVVKGV